MKFKYLFYFVLFAAIFSCGGGHGSGGGSGGGTPTSDSTDTTSQQTSNPPYQGACAGYKFTGVWHAASWGPMPDDILTINPDCTMTSSVCQSTYAFEISQVRHTISTSLEMRIEVATTVDIPGCLPEGIFFCDIGYQPIEHDGSENFGIGNCSRGGVISEPRRTFINKDYLR